MSQVSRWRHRRFNGKNPFGNTGNDTEGSFVNIQNGGLASQSVGPPNNDVEMSCAGRAFDGSGSLGAKMLARTPLGKQLVSPTDSVLGSLSRSPANGLNTTYQAMIDAAFGTTNGANAQAQFSRFWGQAVQAYEATLIPDQTPFDKFPAGNNNAMTNSQKEGWEAFKGDGGGPEDRSCFSCHAGSELSDATAPPELHEAGWGGLLPLSCRFTAPVGCAGRPRAAPRPARAGAGGR